MNVMPHLIALGCLVVGLIAFLYYRYRLTSWEDDTLHVRGVDDGTIVNQVAMAKKIERADLIAKIFVAVVVLYSVGLAAIYGYLQLPS